MSKTYLEQGNLNIYLETLDTLEFSYIRGRRRYVFNYNTTSNIFFFEYNIFTTESVVSKIGDGNLFMEISYTDEYDKGHEGVMLLMVVPMSLFLPTQIEMYLPDPEEEHDYNR